jgi:tetratricopeptide (TPR) repeat protein
MNLLRGIQLHELILMILGFILGLVLIFIFLFTALRSKPNLKLLYGFLAPTVMIGYPSIRSMEFGKDVIKIDKLVQQVNKNPTDTVAIHALIDKLEELPASRCKTSVNAMTTIANAQVSLGSYDSARVSIQKAVELDPTSPKAIESQKAIQEKWNTREEIREHVHQIDHHIRQIDRRPNDKLVRDSLAYNLRQVEQLTLNSAIHLENKQVLSVARAAAITGQKEQAEEIANDVLRLNPNQKEATKLKKDIRDKKFQQAERPKTKPIKPAGQPESDPASRMSKPAIPAPAPVYQDSPHLNLRLIPKTVAPFAKWNIKE